ncbi:MAG: SurA N-terminal domain-containing protein [Alphaproteobacteria bacterium]|nr:SurA N-terminal domain-containing protein [Alphaproteobacteria bacterium]
MIRFFNRFAGSWLSKMILFILTLSMIAFWGLGGLVSTEKGFGQDPIRVGGQAVPMSRLMHAFEAARQQLSRQMMGKYVSPEQALEMGLLDQVVRQHVAELVNAAVEKDLGLTASTAAVQKYVERNPAFAGPTGAFDKNLFYAYLMQTGTNENQLADRLKKELAAQHLRHSVQSVAYVPDALVEIIHRYQNEKRDVSAVLIEPDKIAVAERPTEQQLKDDYEADVEDFMMPERRALTLMRVTPAMMLDKVAVPPEEVEAALAEQRGSFETPEKRAVDQMRFDTAEAARKAMTGLTPANFRQTARTKAGQTDDQTDFGQVAQNELLEDLAAPVFGAKKGAIVGPVQSPMGWHVLLVRDVIPAKTTPAAEMKARIRQRLAEGKTYDTMYEAVRKSEDILGAGGSLEQVESALGLKTQAIQPVDISGKTKAGKQAVENAELMKQAFILQKGETSSFVEDGNGFVVVRVDDILPVKARDFDDVRPELTRRWIAARQKEKLADVAQAVLKRTQGGQPLESQGVFGNFKVLSDTGVTRGNPGKMPAAALPAIFKQKAGLPNAQLTDLPGIGVLVTAVGRITPPKEDAAQTAQMKTALAQTEGEALYRALQAHYTAELGVEVNEKAIQKAFAKYLKTQ